MLRSVAIISDGLVTACTAVTAAPAKKPAAALIITNARLVATTDVSVSVGERTVALARPLAPGAKATLKLPKTTSCIVSVSAAFEDESVAEVEALDICREKTIRLTD